MPSTSRTDGPRHLAGRPRIPAGPSTAAARPSAGEAVDLEAAEVPVPARVPRSRLFFAVAITAAALPVLVIDNLPATADANQQVEYVQSPSTDLPRHLEPASVSPSTTVAPATPVIEATVTVEAPSTTAPSAAEATTTSTTAPAPVVRAVAAPRPVATTAPPTTQAPPARTAARTDPNDPATWDRLARCEAGGSWSANTGNGYYGGLQFSKATWDHLGGSAFSAYPHQATKAQQIEIGQRQYAQSGWSAWPGCRDQLGFS